MLGSSPALLTKILAGEDASLELKEVVFAGDVVKGPTRDGLADEIAAFANARGGLLALGVDDTSKEILGIPLRKLDFVEQLAREVCHDAIDPPVDATILNVRLADSSGLPQWTLVVEIDRSLAVHRSPGGYVRRLGSSKRKMSQEQLARLFRQRSYARLIRFDETAVPGTSLAHLGTALFDRFRTGRTADTRATVARKLGMAAREDGGAMTLTVGGVLLGTAQPEQWLRHAFIQATAYRGTSIAEALDATNYQIDAKDICGPLDAQVAEACRFVARNQKIAARKSLGRADIPQYDMTAVFEAVVNAVAHRDYSLTQSKIRLRMFSDHLELYSPGELVNTMTTDTLAYRQASRNEVITSLLAKCQVPQEIFGLETTRSTLMDRRGEGVPLILERSEAVSGREPRYETIDPSELRLTIFAAGADSERD